MASVKIGLKDLYYAPLTTDTSAAISYSTPVSLANNLIEAKLTVNVNEIQLFADDHMTDTDSIFDSCELELTLRDLTLETQAALLGHTYSGGILSAASTDTAAYVAIGFYQTKANNKKQWIWLTKGKFSIPSLEAKTKGSKPEYQTVTLKGTFLPRDYDSKWKLVADEESASYVSSVGTDWFTVATLQGSGISALTITCSPLDAATGVAVDANVTWTYNNAIDVSYVTEDYFTLTEADGTAIAGAYSIDAAHKVVTFNPTSNLDASTVYLAFASGAVKDIYGQSLAAGNTVTNFTTA